MIVLMRCVAEAVMSKGVRGLMDAVPGGVFLFDVAADALRRLREHRRAADLREEVLSAATAAIDEVKQTAAQVAKEVAPDVPLEDRLALEMYLTQIPGTVRQSLKRAEDPSGRSVPADFALSEPADLLKRLPQRAVQFRTNDPLPGKPGWKLVELLGTGGFGEVWLARNPALSALKGAVKFGLDPQARDRLLRHEGSLVNRVMEQGKHPNVVQLLDAHLDGDAPWLMYEYVPGGDLTGLILSWQQLKPAERLRCAMTALHTLASAVGHFHRLGPPLVHRDLKPANILVSAGSPSSSETTVSAGGDCVAATAELKVSDFGIGGVAAAAALAQESSGRGATGVLVSQLYGAYTPLYASPQQQRGESPDPRDDVHALGVIGYQMLTGKVDATLGADYAKTLRRLEIPEPFIELLGDCAAHDPANRPRDAAETAERLARLMASPQLESQPARPRPVARPVASATTPLPRRPREPECRRTARSGTVRARSRGPFAILIVIGLVLAGAVAGIYRLVDGFKRSPFPTPRASDLIPGVSPGSNERTRAEFARRIEVPGGHVAAVRLSNDPDRVVAIRESVPGTKQVTVYSIPDGKELFSTGKDAASVAALSPDGRRIAMATPTGVEVTELGSRAAIHSLTSPGSMPVWLGYVPSEQVILCNHGGRLLVWNPGDRAGGTRPVAEANGKTPLAIDGDSRVVFDRSGHFAVTGRAGRKTVIGKVGSWVADREVGTAGDRFCTFTTKGDRILTWDGKDIIETDTRPGGKVIGKPHPVDCGEPAQLLLAADDRRLVAVGSTGALLMDRQLGWRPAPISGHRTRITRVAFNPSGSMMATVDAGGTIRLREMTFPDREGEELKDHTGAIRDLQFTPDGEILIAAGADGLFLWKVPNPKRWW